MVQSDPEFEKIRVCMDLEFSVKEWATLAAAILFMMHEMEEAQRTKGPMPPFIMERYNSLKEFTMMVNMRLTLESAEYQGKEPNL